jgi:hypothetical protein
MRTCARGGVVLPFLTSARDGGGWPASSPGRFQSRGIRPRYPLDRRPSGSQSRSGRCGEEKNVASAGNRAEAVQPIAHIYRLELSRLLFTRCIYMFRIILRIDCNCLTKQHLQLGLFNADALPFSVKYELHWHTHTHTHTHTNFEFLLGISDIFLCSRSQSTSRRCAVRKCS